MEAKLIPDFLPFRFPLENRMAQENITFERAEIDKESIRKILDDDIGKLFEKHYESTADILSKCKFVQFDGDLKELETRMLSGESIELMFLLYVGKTRNDLRTNIKTPDLSVLIFLNRLGRFAKLLGDASGKEVSVKIAVENEYMDKYIDRVSSDEENTLFIMKKLMDEFSISNIYLERMENFLGGETFSEEFKRQITSFSKDDGIMLGEKNYSIVNISRYFFPTASFESAVRTYTTDEGNKRIDEMTLQSVIRYRAFMKARDVTGFWERNKRYIRSTVSYKPGVITYSYYVGRLAPLHGVAVIIDGRISTEYFYDVAYAACEANAPIKVLYYGELAMCIDATGLAL